MAMHRLLATAAGGSRTLMLIVGCPHTTPMLGTNVFKAAHFDLGPDKVIIRECVIRTVDWDELE
jgi:hypothetical protein